MEFLLSVDDKTIEDYVNHNTNNEKKQCFSCLGRLGKLCAAAFSDCLLASLWGQRLGELLFMSGFKKSLLTVGLEMEWL